ncbi:MAG: hypothetical protein DME16_23890 [Candidatus Rokuibacteriota bacterium]|nr:MAG: hypothetical protein DME16_23890 [Candidatus Rokubacteria bacterium]
MATEAAPPLLAVESLVAGYGHIQVLRGVDLAVRRGEIVALLGANGSGKSTALNTISGFIRPMAGRIRLDGQDIAGHPPHQVFVRALQVADRALGQHQPVAQRHEAVRDGQGQAHVLLDHQHGRALGLEALDDTPDLRHEHRREPARGLVEEEERGIAHQGATEGHHLLLAPRHRAHALPPAHGQAREELVRSREAGPRLSTDGGAELQVVLDRHVGEEIPSL